MDAKTNMKRAYFQTESAALRVTFNIPLKHFPYMMPMPKGWVVLWLP